MIHLSRVIHLLKDTLEPTTATMGKIRKGRGRAISSEGLVSRLSLKFALAGKDWKAHLSSAPMKDFETQLAPGSPCQALPSRDVRTRKFSCRMRQDRALGSRTPQMHLISESPPASSASQ